MKGSGSTYFCVVIWMVAVVPMLMDALSGVSTPLPKVSQPLSEPQAMTGSPRFQPRFGGGLCGDVSDEGGGVHKVDHLVGACVVEINC